MNMDSLKDTKDNEELQFKAKRVFLNEKYLKMIEMMLPAYNIPTNTKDIEKNSKIIEIAIKNLFKNDFLNRIKEF